MVLILVLRNPFIFSSAFDFLLTSDGKNITLRDFLSPAMVYKTNQFKPVSRIL